MQKSDDILQDIKSAVHDVVPGAKVYLFGSRATGNVHDESDWDVLVLTRGEEERALKWQVHDKLFLVGLNHHTFIHLTFADEQSWQSDAGYYALRLSVTDEIISL